MPKRKFMGSPFEPDQFKEKDPPHLPKYQIPNSYHDDHDDGIIHPTPKRVAKYRGYG
jgi:hypothetical protein